jgi:hypothetical protein
MTDEPKVRTGSPESFGWQRRPDMDTALKGATTGIAYEQPDGALYLFPPGRKPTLTRLEDAEDFRRGCQGDQEIEPGR